MIDLTRIAGRIDFRRYATATFTLIGQGMVGSAIAWKLAQLAPSRLILVDGDDYEPHNRPRHVLPKVYEHMNKAVGMADLIQTEFGRETENPTEAGIDNVTAVPEYVTAEMSDEQIIEELIAPADAVVVATDDVAVQRRIALLARAEDVPAIVPAISEDGGRGEVFVSLGPSAPCICCFDAFRSTDADVRGAAVLNAELSPPVDVTVNACLALLDPESQQARLFEPLRAGGPVPQLFRAFQPCSPEQQTPDDGRTEVPWRQGCPGCGGSSRRPAQPGQPAQPRVSVTPEPPAWEVLQATVQQTREQIEALVGSLRAHFPTARGPSPPPRQPAARPGRGRSRIALWPLIFWSAVVLLAYEGCESLSELTDRREQARAAEQQEEIRAEQAEVEDVVETVVNGGSAAEGCPLLTGHFITKYLGSPRGCRESDHWNDLERSVGSASVTGDHARVAVTDKTGAEATAVLDLGSDAQWRVHDIEVDE